MPLDFEKFFFSHWTIVVKNAIESKKISISLQTGSNCEANNGFPMIEPKCMLCMCSHVVKFSVNCFLSSLELK